MDLDILIEKKAELRSYAEANVVAMNGSVGQMERFLRNAPPTGVCKFVASLIISMLWQIMPYVYFAKAMYWSSSLATLDT